MSSSEKYNPGYFQNAGSLQRAASHLEIVQMGLSKSIQDSILKL